MISKNLTNKKTEVDMSSQAITNRLKRVSQLRRLCISLGHAESINNSGIPITPYKKLHP